MQRVSAFLPSWDRRNSTSASNSNGATPTPKTGGFFGWHNRSSNSTNTLSSINIKAANRSSSAPSLKNGRVHHEAFWPATLDIECEKAARIIKSFCADGYLATLDDEPAVTIAKDELRTPIKIPKKIPKRIIQNAAGIAVFTCMRNGMWMTGSGGSGILIARKSDGTWSPPSGIMLHTPTLSFIMGVDIYDCVLIINTLAALESITKQHVTLGEDVGLDSGSAVPMDAPDAVIDPKELGNTVMTYMKARGQEQKVNLNGCILTERTNENERFYGANVSQMDILAGNIDRHIEETQPLFEVIKMAEGRTDFDPTLICKIALEPAPGDAVLASPQSTPHSPRKPFGVPNIDDPDPFGILALEMAGMEIREAGTRLRPTSSQLDFHPRPISQLSSRINRQSSATYLTRSNRDSCMSDRTIRSQMTDNHTQAEITGDATPETSPSPRRSEDGKARAAFDKIKEDDEELEDDEDVDCLSIDFSPLKHLSRKSLGSEKLPADSLHVSKRSTSSPVVSTFSNEKSLAIDDSFDTVQVAIATDAKLLIENTDDDSSKANNLDTNDADDEDDDEEEPIIFEVATVQPTRTKAVASRMVHAKGSVVTIGKRIPPPLPMRNPARSSLASSRASLASRRSDISPDSVGVRSPLRQAFNESDLTTDEQLNGDEKIEETVEEVSNPERPKQPQALRTRVSILDESDLATPRDPVAQFKESPVDSLESIESQDNNNDVDWATKLIEAPEPVALTTQDLSRATDNEASSLSTSASETSAEEDDASLRIDKGGLHVDTDAKGKNSKLEESPYTTPTSEQRISLGGELEEATPKQDKETRRIPAEDS